MPMELKESRVAADDVFSGVGVGMQVHTIGK